MTQKSYSGFQRLRLEIKKLHDWPDNPADASYIQEDLKQFIITESAIVDFDTVTAVDTAYNEEGAQVFAVAVTKNVSDQTEVERATAKASIKFPYIPTLLSFREGPVIISALSQLKIKPSVLFFSGHGLAHPLHFGLASHIGLLADLPSIGCARRNLAGHYDDPPDEVGAFSRIVCNDRVCGYAFRSRQGVKPIFISPGHKCDLDDALKIIGKCLSGYRMPEALRIAHMAANRLKANALQKEGRSISE